MERRLVSQRVYDAVQEHPSLATEAQRDAIGWISLRRAKTEVLTAELDEDSFFLAFHDWSSFVEHSLGQYAETHADVVASIYTFSTGQTPSFNHSDGEGHSKGGWHNACFFGVVGRNSGQVRDTIASALTNQTGVPEDLASTRLKDATKLAQVYCRNPSDYLRFESNPSWHVEDGRCWAPEGEDVWYTQKRWRQK